MLNYRLANCRMCDYVVLGRVDCKGQGPGVCALYQLMPHLRVKLHPVSDKSPPTIKTFLRVQLRAEIDDK